MKDSTICIDIKNLNKEYECSDFKLNLFNGLNLCIYENEFISILGDGGTGKTTLVNIITGLEQPSKGSVFLFGRDLSKIDDNDFTKLRFDKIGIVFQTPSLISNLTVFENIKLPMIIRKRSDSDQISRIEELLNFLGISKKSTFLPNELSLGERKKVEIARALVLDPPLIILDEPIANLDSPTRNAFIPFIRGLKYLHNRTVIITTNNLKVAKIANREIYLERPKLVSNIREKNLKG